MSRTTTASATVFVDAFVNGDLPPVCVNTGGPATGHIPVHRQVDGPSAAWFFLILLGPTGWIALIFVMGLARRSYLDGWVPTDLDRWRELRSTRRKWLMVVAAGAGLTMVLAFGFLREVAAVSLLIAVPAMLFGAVALWTRRTGPAVTLDGSRRWVTLHRVHPAFAAAVAEVSATDRSDSRTYH